MASCQIFVRSSSLYKDGSKRSSALGPHAKYMSHDQIYHFKGVVSINVLMKFTEISKKKEKIE